MARTRRTFNAEFKAKVVLEIISGNKSMAEACREYSLKADLLSHWKSQFMDNASKVFEAQRKWIHNRHAWLSWNDWQASKAWSWKS